jgi:hypothetical protein
VELTSCESCGHWHLARSADAACPRCGAEPTPSFQWADGTARRLARPAEYPSRKGIPVGGARVWRLTR